MSEGLQLQGGHSWARPNFSHGAGRGEGLKSFPPGINFTWRGEGEDVPGFGLLLGRGRKSPTQGLLGVKVEGEAEDEELGSTER